MAVNTRQLSSTNPFYIQPANVLPGFGALMQGVGSRIEYERGKAEETRKQGLRQKLSTIVQNGDPDKIFRAQLVRDMVRNHIQDVLFRNNVKTGIIKEG